MKQQTSIEGQSIAETEPNFAAQPGAPLSQAGCFVNNLALPSFISDIFAINGSAETYPASPDPAVRIPGFLS